VLPQPNRLRKDREFNEVYRRGKRWTAPALVLHRLPQPNSPLKVGIVCSRKVGKAVLRNLLRRWVREIFRRRWPELRPGFNLVVVLQPAAAQLNFQDMDQQLGSLLERAEVIGGHSGRSHV